MNYTLEQELKMLFLEAVEKASIKRRIPFKYTCIESGATQKAIPDTIITLNKRPGWLEFKRMNSTQNALVKYEPGQLNELRTWSLHGMFSATVGITQGQDFIIAVPNKVLLGQDLTTKLFCLKSNKLYVTGRLSEQLDALLNIMNVYYKGGTDERTH